MAETGRPATLLRSTWTHVVFAFIAMGAWAAFANSGHGNRAMAIAFVVQGALSGIITAVMKRWLEHAQGKLFAGLPALPRLLTGPAISAAVTGTLLFVAHSLAGTPEVIRTIAVPWSVSTLYAFVYTATLERRG
jgi:hypothetical protein